MLPEEYSAITVQNELDALRKLVEGLLYRVTMIPTPSAPLDPKEGWVAISDGTGSGFDAVSGAGMYRYNGSTWTFIG
jgi:hypothetical protein